LTNFSSTLLDILSDFVRNADSVLGPSTAVSTARHVSSLSPFVTKLQENSRSDMGCRMGDMAKNPQTERGLGIFEEQKRDALSCVGLWRWGKRYFL
jgi:hypothetical protein